MQVEIYGEQYNFGATKYIHCKQTTLDSVDILVIEILEMLIGNFSSHVATWGSDLKVLHLNFVLLPQVVTKLSAAIVLSSFQMWIPDTSVRNPCPPSVPCASSWRGGEQSRMHALYKVGNSYRYQY